MPTSHDAAPFRERLVPGPWLFVALLLLIPAVALVMTPIFSAIAWPAAVIVYVLAAGSFLLLAPTVEVADGELIAGRARIPVALLGAVETLDADQLRAVIGPGADARAYLMLRGYVHSGIRVSIEDPDDPTPYWVVTSRRPKSLRDSIERARAKE